MPNKTIYFKDEDVQILSSAQDMLESSVSATITEALRFFVESKMETQRAAEAQQAIRDLMNEIFSALDEPGTESVFLEPASQGGRLRIRSRDNLVVHRTYDLVEYHGVISALSERIIEKLAGMPGVIRGLVEYSGEDSVKARCRVVLQPTILGQTMALFPDMTERSIPKIEQLSPNALNHELIKAMIGSSHGLIVVTGLGGCGKSTTQRAMISALDADRLRICSVEDPVEVVLPGVVQVPARPRMGVSIRDALAGVMQSDPDVVLVPEIRDSETAMLVTQLALVGHLVVVGLHATSTVGAVERLLDVGVPDFLLKEALVGVVAQKLVTCKAGKRENSVGLVDAARVANFEILVVDSECRARLKSADSGESFLDMVSTGIVGTFDADSQDLRDKGYCD